MLSATTPPWVPEPVLALSILFLKVKYNRPPNGRGKGAKEPKS